MQDCLLDHRPEQAIPLRLVVENNFSPWLEEQPESLRRWVISAGFKAKAGSLCLVPNREAGLTAALLGVTALDDLWACGDLAKTLPEGNYYLDGDYPPAVKERLTLGWALGSYQFARYKKVQPVTAKLVVDPDCDRQHLENQIEAIRLVRDLINTPAEDMMPEHLADVVEILGKEFGAQVDQIVGNQLLAQNFPAIHAVGRASTHLPRLLDLRWGEETFPKVTLVGKGVCFDSGGLDLKPSNNMRLMKKDMGGAAHVMGLARLIMGANLPVRLRLLIAAVENAVAGNAFRPGDILRTRKGLTVEIENTDAEGRLILCDALAEAGNEKPELLIDFATLTGAARVALGTDVPALFSEVEELAAGLLAACEHERDPLWRLPLHQPYREMLESKIADLANASKEPFAGAITAALFLREFIPPETAWAHFDIMAWNIRTRPGRPEGGEAMGIRAVFHYLRQRFGRASP
jgi:leucyl aminopeptidase